MYTPYDYLSEQQIELNKTFPLDRRKEMFLGASKDKLGNSVVCYRHMTKQHLETILGNEIITHENYIKNQNYNIDNFIYYILKRYFEYIGKDGISKNIKQITDGKTKQEKKDIVGKIIQQRFSIKQNISEIINSRHKLIKFIKQNLQEDFVKSVHAGSTGIEFSPYFSWSIGGYSGNFTSSLYKGDFYLEAIIPDNFIIENKMGSNNEKEILTTQINKNWITRIYMNSEILAHETLGEEFDYCNIGIRNYFLKNKENNRHFNTQIYNNENFKNIADRWRFKERTELYLPIKNS